MPPPRPLHVLPLGFLVGLLGGVLPVAWGCGGGGDDASSPPSGSAGAESVGGRPSGGNGSNSDAGVAHGDEGGTMTSSGAASGASGGAAMGGAAMGGAAMGGAAMGGAATGGAAMGGAGASPRDCTDAFTSPLIDPADVTVVTPIGLVGGGGTEIVGRSYIFPREGQGEIALRAPTAMTLVGGTRYLPPGAPEGYHPDWALAFTPDCSSAILIELYHVKEVAPAISAVLGDDVAASSAWQALPREQRVHFAAGDAIGGYLHGLNSVAFDFIVKDEDVTNQFAEPQRYQNSNLLHVVCPYRYYTPELRGAFDELLGAPGAGPIPGTQCGSVATDVIGTLVGQWYLNPDVSTGRGNLSLVGGYGNPHPIGKNPDDSITFGNIGASNQGYRVYADAESWVAPEEVTDEHCYQLGPNGSPQGWLYYVLVSDTEMRVFHGDAGECPNAPPASGGQTYYR